MADNTQQNLHAIFITLHLQGHVNPSVSLAIKLAQRGFTITFIVKDNVNLEIKKALLQGAAQLGRHQDDNIFSEICSSLGLDIRYVTVSDGLPHDFDKKANFEQHLHQFLYEYEAYMDEAVGKIVKLNSGSGQQVNVVIADTIYPWISKIAKKYELAYVSFWTEPALVFSLYCHLHLLRQNGHVYCQDKREDAIDYIPGVKSIKPKYLPSCLQETENSTLMHRIIFTAFDDVKNNADFVLCNTIHELERDTISGLQSTGMPFYPIGPTFPPGFRRSLVPTSFWTETSCSDWLDSKPQGSVLYVSFGSLANISKDTITEVANGLLLSEVQFVWVHRPGTDVISSSTSDGSLLLPADFTEGVQGRGLIVPWTCQITVLSHPSIGGFLTHCGWNSILESIWCKIPMLCIPQFTDQLTNRKLVVDDWKIGLDLCNNKPLKKDVISENIKILMSQQSDWLKENIAELRLTLEGAMKEDGSSEKNIDLFIKKLKSKTENK